MERQKLEPKEAVRMTPLLRSIAVEIAERSETIAELEGSLAVRRAHPRRDAKGTALLTARLANHRRELRLAEKELARLGWNRDDQLPMRFVRPGTDGAADMTWQLDQTGFYRPVAEVS